jgi:hypothetical protein
MLSAQQPRKVDRPSREDDVTYAERIVEEPPL